MPHAGAMCVLPSAQPDSMALASGTRLGTYEVIATLGAGGMGEVYRAHHSTLRRDVAIKVLPDAVAADPERIARFEREARAVAALSHPNILAIHDFGNDHGVHYAVTELLEGQTLREALHGGPMPVPRAVAMATQIARGLDAAHTRGIVHRDLKPENLFVLGDGHLKILDFGLAKESARAGIGHDAGATVTAATDAGTVLGTAGYMSPEQVRGEPVDHRSDLFSLGCVLYEMLAGRRAFAGTSSIDTMHATLHDDPPDVATLATVPPSLARIVSRCLEKKAADRFQSAADLRFALESTTDARSASAARVPSARPRVSARLVVFAAVGILAIGTATYYWLAARSSPTSPAAAAPQQAHGIAVLPFENLGEAGQAYFAAGVTEEVTLHLAKIGALRVMSRSAVARFKDPAAQLAEMTRELKIGAILTGSVRHAGSQVRVGVQLLAAPSGETLWSEQYDRTVDNIFDVQSDIAVRVARTLQASLAPDERARIERAPTANAEAYELYLKQRPLDPANPTKNAEGLALLQKAIALDQKFALAHVALTRRLVFRGHYADRADYMAALDSGRTAVAIDPQLARAHYAVGQALSSMGRMDEARLSMQRAIELDSNYWAAMVDLGLLEMQSGRIDQSVYWDKRALPLAPNIAHSYYHLGIPMVVVDPDAAERFLSAAARRFPMTDPSGGHRLPMLLATIDFNRGHAAAAVERLRPVEAANPGNAEITVLLNELAAYAGTADAAERLDRSLKTSAGARGWWARYTPRTLRAHLFMRSGQPARARPLVDAALEGVRQSVTDGDRSSGPFYEEAGLQLMLGNRNAALELVEKAIDAGFVEPAFTKLDPLLADVRNEPRFVAAVQRMERIVADMRSRIDLSDVDRLGR